MSKIIVLEAVYNNSDLMSDYFDSDHRLEEWYVCDLEGKAVTEAKLRRALQHLPKWLRQFNWSTYQKGENYSMSDHPHGQLRADEGTGLTTKNALKETVSIRFILTVSYSDIFSWNHKLDDPIPETLEAFKTLIQQRDQETQRREQELKPIREEAMRKVVEEATAVIDREGFRILKHETRQVNLTPYIT